MIFATTAMAVAQNTRSTQFRCSSPHCTGECEYARTMQAQHIAQAKKKSPFEFGVKAGLNTGNFRVERDGILDNMGIRIDGRTGYHAGVYARLNIAGGFFIQPEGVYNWDRYDIRVWQAGTGEILRHNTAVRVRVIEVPALAGWNIGSSFRLMAGPVFSFENTSFERGGVVTDSDLMRPKTAFTVGIGGSLGSRVSIDIRRCWQFKKDGNTVTIDDRLIDLGDRFTGWTFSIGYRLIPAK